jgi:hypothetical protein
MKFSIGISILLVIAVVLFGCKEYELDFDEEIIARNFSVEMDENPENGYVIGTLNASTTYERIDFKIDRQNPEGAFAVDAKKGTVTVADATKFDYEKDSVITGTVIVSNPNNSDSLKVNIKLRDIAE